MKFIMSLIIILILSSGLFATFQAPVVILTVKQLDERTVMISTAGSFDPDGGVINNYFFDVSYNGTFSSKLRLDWDGYAYVKNGAFTGSPVIDVSVGRNYELAQPVFKFVIKSPFSRFDRWNPTIVTIAVRAYDDEIPIYQMQSTEIKTIVIGGFRPLGNI